MTHDITRSFSLQTNDVQMRSLSTGSMPGFSTILEQSPGVNVYCKLHFIHDIYNVRWDCIHFLSGVDSLKSVNFLLPLRLLQICLSISQPMKLLLESPDSFWPRQYVSVILPSMVGIHSPLLSYRYRYYPAVKVHESSWNIMKKMPQ